MEALWLRSIDSKERNMKTRLADLLAGFSHRAVFLIVLAGFVVLSGAAWAAGDGTLVPYDFTSHWAGFTALGIFLVAYALVIVEEFTDMRKSMPVIMGAGLIWLTIGLAYSGTALSTLPADAVRHYLVEFAELLLFLMVAMTYVNAMSERNVFETLRFWLVNRGLSYRQMFWITGIMSFFMSPIIDNLTTALVIGAVVVAVGKDNPKFVGLACINIVVAANAGGAFSPFGDITTLMVWQKNLVDFYTFLALFVPSVVNYIIPAILMSFFVPSGAPSATAEQTSMKRGGKKDFRALRPDHPYNGLPA